MGDPGNDGKVFRQLSVDMRDGLKNIYHQISTASAENATSAKPAEALFTEASDQLSEVVKTTESATMRIMEIVEQQLEKVAETTAIIEKLKKGEATAADIECLAGINASLGDNLTEVLTTLSFQDLTGQRIKKVVEALNAIENSVVELYVSSGLVLEAAEKTPQRDAGQIREEARQAVEDFRHTRKGGSELKGPDKNGISQTAIDDMLAQLGL